MTPRTPPRLLTPAQLDKLEFLINSVTLTNAFKPECVNLFRALLANHHALSAALVEAQQENARLRAAISDAHRWELERLLERVRRDDPDNFPLIQAVDAALRGERGTE